MTIDRAAVATYLDTQYSSLAAAVGQSATPSTGYSSDIDNALRKLGKTESELATAEVEDGDRDALFTLAEYYAARRFWRLLSDRVNTNTGITSYNFTAQLNNIEKLVADAQRRCEALGYDVSGSGWSAGWLNLDWAETETAL
jgi:hypothetical protein